MTEWQPIATYRGFQVVCFAAQGRVWPGHRSNSRAGALDEFVWLHIGGHPEPTHWMPLPAPPTPDLLLIAGGVAAALGVTFETVCHACGCPERTQSHCDRWDCPLLLPDRSGEAG